VSTVPEPARRTVMPNDLRAAAEPIAVQPLLIPGDGHLTAGPGVTAPVRRYLMVIYHREINRAARLC